MRHLDLRKRSIPRLGTALIALLLFVGFGLSGCGESPGSDGGQNQTSSDDRARDAETGPDAGPETNPAPSAHPDAGSPDGESSPDADSEPEGDQDDERFRSNSELAYPPTFEVDDSLDANRQKVSGIDGSSPRPVARIADSLGNGSDFVANELVLSAEKRSTAEAVAKRWNGKILSSFDPPDPEYSNLKTQYILRVDPSSADPSNLGASVLRINMLHRGSHRVSSKRALKLIAALVREKNERGLEVGLNWLYSNDSSTTLSDGPIREASSSDVSGARSYKRDASRWHYMNGSGAVRIRVTDAWKALQRENKLSNSPTVGIIDGGFTHQPDLPDRRIYPDSSAWGRKNPMGCGDTPCPYHGTKVAYAAAAIPDNGMGVAGPGGPVAELALGENAEGTFASIMKHAASLVREIAQKGRPPAAVNMSFSTTHPAVGAAFTAPAMSKIMKTTRSIGTLPVASAGNEGKHLDATDCAQVCAFGKCVGPCWEESATLPCEAKSVMCVGGTEWKSKERDGNSNYGTDGNKSVDIYAPYEMWLGKTPKSSKISTSHGTSYSAPFVAGVAALVKAADPSLGPDRIASILKSTARSGKGKADRIVNAFGAVKKVFGDVAPHADIEKPVDGSDHSFGRTVRLSSEAADFEDNRFDLERTWRSNLDGELTPPSADLRAGRHKITLEVTDSAGNTSTDSVHISVTNKDPYVEIVQPDRGAKFEPEGKIEMRALTKDPDLYQTGEQAVPDENVVWSVLGGRRLGKGHVIRVDLSKGWHIIEAEATDGRATSRYLTVVEIRDIPGNEPPQNISILDPDSTIMTGSVYDDYTEILPLSAAARDPDPNDQLTYRWYTGRGRIQPTELGSGRTTSAKVHWEGPCGCVTDRIVVEVSDGTSTRTRSKQVCLRVFCGR